MNYLPHPVRSEDPYVYSVNAILPKNKKGQTSDIMSGYEKETCNMGCHGLLCGGTALLKFWKASVERHRLLGGNSR